MGTYGPRVPGAAQGPLLSATRIRPNELEGVNNASGPSRGPGGLLRPRAVAAFRRGVVIRFEIKGGTKYEFKFDIYSSGEMTYSGKVSSFRGGWGWEERRQGKPSALRGGPGWPRPGPLAPIVWAGGGGSWGGGRKVADLRQLLGKVGGGRVGGAQTGGHLERRKGGSVPLVSHP